MHVCVLETKPDSRGDWVPLLWRLPCVSLMLLPHFRDWLGCHGAGDTRSGYNPHPPTWLGKHPGEYQATSPPLGAGSQEDHSCSWTLMGNTLGMANQDDTRPMLSALVRRQAACVGGPGGSARASWNSSLSHCTHHSRVASAHNPRDVTELSMNTNGILDRELFMEGDTSHTQTRPGPDATYMGRIRWACPHPH